MFQSKEKIANERKTTTNQCFEEMTKYFNFCMEEDLLSVRMSIPKISDIQISIGYVLNKL